MIEFTKSYKASDGSIFLTIEEAKEHEVLILFKEPTEPATDEQIAMARMIIEKSEKLVDILTTTATSKPRARKVNGGSKQRKPKTPAPEAS